MPPSKQNGENDQLELLNHNADTNNWRSEFESAADAHKDYNDPYHDPGLILKLYHQADCLVFLGGLVAFFLGIVAAVDATNTNHNLKEQEKLLHDRMYNMKLKPTYFRDNIVNALIIFGGVTALGWNVTSRACLRAVSSEATTHLVRGIRQKDFSKIFELGLPDALWFSWRMKLWKSTTFAALQIALYVGTALSYRLAFQDGERAGKVGLGNTYSTFLLGCQEYPDSLGIRPTFAKLLGASNFSESVDEDLPMAPYVIWNASATSWLDDSSWQPVVGWHGSNFQLHVGEQTGFQRARGWSATLTGPFLTGVLQEKKSPARGSYGQAGWYQTVSNHPKCGPLPLLCRYVSEVSSEPSGVVPTCYWAGLMAENMTAKFTQQPLGAWERNEAYFLQESGSTPFFGSDCPLEMKRTFLDSFTNATQRNGDVTWDFRQSSWSYGSSTGTVHGLIQDNMAEWIQYFGWLIANLQTGVLEETYPDREGNRKNSSALTRLREQRLWRPEIEGGYDPSVERWCRPRGLGQDDMPNYEGSADFVYATNEWVSHQAKAAVFLILWGISLTAMAYPFKSIIVNSSLNQYMSFGADFGRENMLGASSGHAPANDESIWQLKLQVTDSGNRRFVMKRRSYEHDASEGSEESMRITINKRYL